MKEGQRKKYLEKIKTHKPKVLKNVLVKDGYHSGDYIQAMAICGIFEEAKNQTKIMNKISNDLKRLCNNFDIQRDVKEKLLELEKSKELKPAHEVLKEILN